MEEDEEIIFATELLKLSGPQDGKKRSFWMSPSWKKRYFVLKREGDVPYLVVHDQQPKNNNDKPKERISLYPSYYVEKHYEYRGKSFVVEFYTPDKRLTLATDDEKIFHLFVFFVQSQTKLKEDLEGECFVVRPDNSECQRRLGARGSMCLLHISPWGVTLALQLSKCVLGQWPLKCIRTYESSGKGQFSVDAGSRSPMGEGTYVFNTRIGQDNGLYDRLDGYVMEAARNRSSNPHGSSGSLSSLDVDFGHLQALTVVSADVRFTNHLKKISREIYDHLWQHLGTDLSPYNKPKGASPEMGATLPSQRMQSAPIDRSTSVPTPEVSTRTHVKTPQSFHGRNVRARSNPYHTMDGASPKSQPDTIDGSATWSKGPARHDSSSSSASQKDSSPPKSTVAASSPPLESQYLHMGSPSSTGSGYMSTTRQNSQSTSHSSYELAKGSDYLLAGATPAVTPPSELLREDGSLAGTPPLLRRPGDRTRNRLRSKSMDDVTEYMSMSSENLNAGGDNERDTGVVDTDEPQKYVYSYASSKQIMNMCTLPRSANNTTVENGTEVTVSHYTVERRRKSFTNMSAKNQALRKSLSNPNMIEDPPASHMDHIHPQSPPLQKINPWHYEQSKSGLAEKRTKPELKPLELKQIFPPHLQPVHVRGGSEPSRVNYSRKENDGYNGRRSPGSDQGGYRDNTPPGGRGYRLPQTVHQFPLSSQSPQKQMQIINPNYKSGSVAQGISPVQSKQWSPEQPIPFTSSIHQSQGESEKSPPAYHLENQRIVKSPNHQGYHDNRPHNTANERTAISSSRSHIPSNDDNRRLRSPADVNGNLGSSSKDNIVSKSPVDNSRGFQSSGNETMPIRKTSSDQRMDTKSNRLSSGPVSPQPGSPFHGFRSSAEHEASSAIGQTIIHSSDSSLSSRSSRDMPSPTSRPAGGFQSLPQTTAQTAPKDRMHVDVNAISMTGETRVFRRQRPLGPEAPSTIPKETEVVVGSSHFFISQEELSGDGNPMQGRKLPSVPLDHPISETPC